jgi:hypothetical protein
MSSDLLAWLRQHPPKGNAAWGDPFPASRVLRPDWPRLAEAAAIVRRWRPAVEPSEDRAILRSIWEAFAANGLIPGEWLDDERRWFVSTSRAPVHLDVYSAELPLKRLALIAFAAGAGDVMLAESLLQEHRDAVALWPATRRGAADVVRWYCDNTMYPGQWSPVVWSEGVPLKPSAAAQRALDIAGIKTPREVREGIEEFVGRAAGLHSATFQRSDAVPCFRRLFEYASTWREAAARGLTVPDVGGALAGREFSSLPDPYAPLVSIWALGFAAPLGSGADLAMPAWNVGPRWDSEMARQAT